MAMVLCLCKWFASLEVQVQCIGCLVKSHLLKWEKPTSCCQTSSLVIEHSNKSFLGSVLPLYTAIFVLR